MGVDQKIRNKSFLPAKNDVDLIKMKLLTITNSDTIGGAARIAFRIHTALTSKGIDSKMLVIYKNSNDDNVISKSETIRKNKLIRFYYNLIFKVVKNITN